MDLNVPSPAQDRLRSTVTAKTQRKELPPFFNRVNKIAPTFFIEQLQLLGAAVWDPFLKGDVDHIERIQQ